MYCVWLSRDFVNVRAGIRIAPYLLVKNVNWYYSFNKQLICHIFTVHVYVLRMARLFELRCERALLPPCASGVVLCVVPPSALKIALICVQRKPRSANQYMHVNTPLTSGKQCRWNAAPARSNSNSQSPDFQRFSFVRALWCRLPLALASLDF